MTRQQALLIAAAARLSDRNSINHLDFRQAVEDALKLEEEVLAQVPGEDVELVSKGSTVAR